MRKKVCIFFYDISKAFDMTTHQLSIKNADWPKPHAMKELVPTTMQAMPISG